MQFRTEKNRQGKVRTYLPALILLVALGVGLYRPDRPVAVIPPGSSAGPAFVVQIIRPRLGLPLGGVLPPQWFGLEAHLGFDHTSPDAAVEFTSPRQLHFRAEDWELHLALDAGGRPTADTEVMFKTTFEGTPRRLRGHPANPVTGTLTMQQLADSGAWSGHFDLEIDQCLDAATGLPLGWPPEPLVLRGSFDRVPILKSP